MNICSRCHGCTVRDRFDDTRAEVAPIDGWKCVNCGSCGDLPDATWKWKQRLSIQPYRLQPSEELRHRRAS